MSVPHDAILFPGNQVLDTGLNTQVASRAGVYLLGLRGANGLHGVAIAVFVFRPPKPRR